jgi:KaiC/GvpD/RAD55 family RecA-like ATPase
MRRNTPRSARSPDTGLAKAPTGIDGVDQITGGGLPRGRPTLVCGAAGSGKTLFAIEFLVRGATRFDEPGVLVTFEETADELRANVRSLGFDLDQLVKRRQLIVDHVRVQRSEVEETGEYNLDGLFVRLAHAIDTVKAKRVVLDTIEAVFLGFSDDNLLRAELRRLFGWLKDKGVTAVITGERGDHHLTRRGLEEYVSDCVIHAARPSSHGLEMHLVSIHKLVRDMRPRAIAMDPISNLITAGTHSETSSMLIRLIDFFKASGITALFTSLTSGGDDLEQTDIGVSSLIDSWLLVRDVELNGERNRTLVILKSRGMNHSNQVREFLLTSAGIELRDAYIGTHGVLTGSARLGQEARDREAELNQVEQTVRMQTDLVTQRHAIEAQIAGLQAQLRGVAGDLDRLAGNQRRRGKRASGDQRAMSASRRAPRPNGLRHAQ